MDQIEEIKAKIDIVELVGSYVNLKQAGGTLRVCVRFIRKRRRHSWLIRSCRYTSALGVERVAMRSPLFRRWRGGV